MRLHPQQEWIPAVADHDVWHCLVVSAAAFGGRRKDGFSQHIVEALALAQARPITAPPAWRVKTMQALRGSPIHLPRPMAREAASQVGIKYAPARFAEPTTRRSRISWPN